jgi:hypothetical protein
MEKGEVSLHQVKIFEFVRKAAGWVTAKDVAAGSDVAERTARLHCLNLVNLGIFDQAEVFPAHRYRLSEKAGKRNKAYMIRLEAAKEVFGIE